MTLISQFIFHSVFLFDVYSLSFEKCMCLWKLNLYEVIQHSHHLREFPRFPSDYSVPNSLHNNQCSNFFPPWILPDINEILLFRVRCLFLSFDLKNNFIYLFIFGCAGSSLLHGLFSSCGKQGLLSSCGVQASHCCGFSCGAWALGWVTSAVAALRL